jgi:hypothetical protein
MNREYVKEAAYQIYSTVDRSLQVAPYQVILIGGASLALQGVIENTDDIDIVVGKESFEPLVSALSQKGKVTREEKIIRFSDALVRMQFNFGYVDVVIGHLDFSRWFTSLQAPKDAYETMILKGNVTARLRPVVMIAKDYEAKIEDEKRTFSRYCGYVPSGKYVERLPIIHEFLKHHPRN